MNRLIRAAVGAAAVVVVMVATGCAPALPSDGPVHTVEAPGPEQYAYAQNPQPPQEGASPEQVIRGFLEAGAGPQNDYQVAREHMTSEAATNWSPDAETFVYAADPTFQEAEGQSFSVEIQVDRRVDSSGSMTRPGGFMNFSFELAEVDGEWRIAQAPDGKILAADTFHEVFNEYTLYFYDPQERYAVPDMRWFINRPGLAAEIVNRILDGPAPWLDDGVTSAFSAEASLGSPSVPVSEHIATVDLDAAAVASASDRDLVLMRHQLSMALAQLSTVREVQLTSNGGPLDVPEPGELPDDQQLNIATRPTADETQVGIVDGSLVRQTGQSTHTIPGLPDISGLDPRFPAVPSAPTEQVFAVMDGDLESLYHVRPETAEPELLVESDTLTRPSMDNFGWTWTVTHSDEGDPTIRAFSYQDPSETTSTQFDAGFLEGRQVLSLRISQDGARAALVVEDAGERSLYIASVIRDGSSGTPRGLGGQYLLSADVEMGEVRWFENDEVMVWEPWGGDEDDFQMSQVQRISLSGDTADPEDGVTGLLNVSIGEGQSNIYLEQFDAGVYARVGDGWNAQEDIEVSDLSYPG